MANRPWARLLAWLIDWACVLGWVAVTAAVVVVVPVVFWPAATESSRAQASVGKRLRGLRVVDVDTTASVPPQVWVLTARTAVRPAPQHSRRTAGNFGSGEAAV